MIISIIQISDFKEKECFSRKIRHWTLDNLEAIKKESAPMSYGLHPGWLYKVITLVALKHSQKWRIEEIDPTTTKKNYKATSLFFFFEGEETELPILNINTRKSFFRQSLHFIKKVFSMTRTFISYNQKFL